MRQILILLLCAAMVLLAACGGEEPQNAKRKLIVATDATLPPMSFLNDQNRLAGFEVDLIGAVAREAGFEYDLINVEWNGLFGGLITKKYDLVISSVTILEERKERMAFSVPYLQSGLSLVVRRDTEGVTSLEDVQAQDGVVGAQRATTAFFYLEDYPELNKQAYELYGHAIQDLIKGEITAVLGESTGTLYYKNNDAAVFREIKMVGDILTEEHYGIVARKGETELLQRVNDALKKLLDDGTVQRLHEKWELGQAAMVPKTVASGKEN
ncbi:transporter substrate-binding domain-containing protein [Nitrospina gracilis]|uniref:transporter substrate-binding domain-containing protein n=1 Tax=Nitrospina gracilis TaxID=35801 RepID=UPI001F406BFA|nr:transporter substrate-binding domain-containing protein [Nitrospina gracilis]MCF8719449.1 polar amino acid transport system substrate-binding protein [Nitrospina gracilis Nb-211]